MLLPMKPMGDGGARGKSSTAHVPSLDASSISLFAEVGLFAILQDFTIIVLLLWRG
jgi:hypothetical protein